jgi:hypothetical protein
MIHKHRIKPGYEGGEYIEGNVVELTVTQHAMWHFAEWQRKGNWEDELAWRLLSGQIGKEDGIKLLLSEAGKKGGKKTGELMKTPEARQRVRQQMLGTRLSAETRAKMRKSAARAGRQAQAKVLVDLANSPHKPIAGRRGMLVRWGWHGLFPSDREFRIALSETFVDYYSKYGKPSISKLAQ